MFIAYFCAFFLLSVGGIFLVLRLRHASPGKLILGFLVLAVIPLIGIYYYSFYVQIDPDTNMPSFIGLSEKAAYQLAAQSRLSLVVTDKIYNPSFPEDTIVKQHPSAGQKTKTDRKVEVIVSVGKKYVVIPNLVGKVFYQAKSLIQATDLTIGEVSSQETSDSAPQTVLEQSPSAGEEVPAGTAINLKINMSPSSSNETE